MTELRGTTNTGTDTVLGEAAVKEFRGSLRGGLLIPGEDGYEDARKVWNGMIDRRPALIACCAGVSDVINAIDFARANNLLLSVRGGGHNVAGSAVCDGGIMIDLSRMKSVRVDPVNGKGRAEPGLTWGELDRETQAFGLATTGGVVSTTGIAGLTLGGGVGWLGRKHGLTSDNLLSVDIVTADGQTLTASDTNNPDLFWGVRGGGGNFGVITSFEYRLHPVGPAVLAGLVIHPLEKAKEAFRFYYEYSSTAPDELDTAAVLLTSPEGHPVLAIAVCYDGPIEEGERLLRPVRDFGPPLADQIAPMPYTQWQSATDALFPSGRHYYWKSNFMKEIGDAAIDTLVNHFEAVPSPQTVAILFQIGGAIGRRGPNETAFSFFGTARAPAYLTPSRALILVALARDLFDYPGGRSAARIKGRMLDQVGACEDSKRIMNPELDRWRRRPAPGVGLCRRFNACVTRARVTPTFLASSVTRTQVRNLTARGKKKLIVWGRNWSPGQIPRRKEKER